MKLHRLAISNMSWGASSKNGQEGQPWPSSVRVVDFDALPAHGITRLAGPVGAGKSTVLSFAGPATLFYRDPNQGDIYSFAGVGPAFSELTFSIGGHTYVARVDVATAVGKRGKSAGKVKQTREWRLFRDGDPRPIAQGGGAYDEAIREIVGSREDVLATAYQLQRNSEYDAGAITSFASASPDQSEEILRRYMALERIQDLVEAGEQRLATLRQEQAALRPRLLERATVEDGLAALRERLDSARTVETEALLRLADCTKRASDAEAALAAVQSQVNKATQASQALAALKGEQEARSRAEQGLAHAGAQCATAASALAHADLALAHAQDDFDAAKAQATDAAARLAAYQRATQELREAESAFVDATATLAARERELGKSTNDVASSTARRDAAQLRLAELVPQIAAAQAAAADADKAVVEAAAAFQAVRDEGIALADTQKAPLIDRKTAAHEGLVLAQAEVRRLADDLARNTTSAQLCGDVPCHGDGDFASCPLLTQAVAARAEIPALLLSTGDADARADRCRADVASIDEQLAQVERDIAAVRNRAAELLQTKTDATAAKSAVGAELQRLRAAEATASQDMAVLSERIATTRQAVERAQAAVGAARVAVDAARSKLDAARERHAATPAPGAGDPLSGPQARLQAAQARRRAADEALQAANRTLAQAEGALARCRPVESVADAVAAAEAQIAAQPAAETLAGATRDAQDARTAAADANRATHEATRTANELVGEIRGIERRLAEFEPLLEDDRRLGHAIRIAERLTQDLKRLIRLRIDANLDTLTGCINRLLSRVSDGRFQVAFEVETVTKGGRVKPAYELIVYDALTGSTRPVRSFSGGQQALMRMAVQFGLMLFANANRANPLQTVYLDEFDSPFNADYRERVIAMTRAFLAEMQQLVGDVRVLVISHAEDFDSDAVLDVETIPLMSIADLPTLAGRAAEQAEEAA